jgi:hypothetical protein
MKNITQILQESTSKADPNIRESLLNFVNAKSPEFEAAQDAIAIEAILNEAVSANSITQEGKSFLLNAVQNYLATNPSGTDTGDPNKTKTKSDESSVDKVLNAGSITAITTAGLLWLLTLYLAAIWLAVGSLSSIQFRDDIENKYNTTLNETLKLKDLQVDADQYRSSMKEKVSSWERELWELAIIFGVNPDTLLGDPESYKQWCGSEKQSEEVMKTCNRLSMVLSDLLNYQQKMNIKDKSLAEAIKVEANKTPNDLEARIGFMLKFNFGDMLKMPVQVLTLLLVIAMGVLGSTITMTWTFLSESTSLPLRWYLLRPFVGALSALVIFIFAKAGQMSLITDAASASLSPFMLSLLGIAAGLLSDRAYSQMASVSGRFLGNMGAEQERWSSHLEEELKKQNMTPEALAAALNLDKHRTEEIITGSRKASLLEQQRISDRLGVTPRLLFTDIPPDQ